MIDQEMSQEKFQTQGERQISSNNYRTNAGGAVSSSHMQVWSKNLNC